ncbi:hypothetical protein L6164_002664 [Bauhinia variegata]|uniref:Uncharacterized protein n=1 Tax=Bauhinia variegata TaxID=167791 RepID=A0ACB9PZ21_BAUVA|nr:hypothetical protein L6164_002664 [Bauhinia variegata]
MDAPRMVTDIPGTTGATLGQEVVCYENPRPSLGIHRFVFVLFRQLGRQTVYAPGWRQNFNTRDFAELYNLGSPVAAVYFNCQTRKWLWWKENVIWLSFKICTIGVKL